MVGCGVVVSGMSVVESGTVAVVVAVVVVVVVVVVVAAVVVVVMWAMRCTHSTSWQQY